ncbi:hemerythrin HHE cation binding domain-containing protein [Haloactinopolyspora alba]|uniref:Hemerythrin HHE cation binding domain-containing protein n=1 Tax=Haloactinopolyspora alba TaxID=648780 RepID=A0A2P8EBM9_9ACTN|nr:LLM class flavin-dependent oxidoreductase [Haloactinopolyspora alba]PSL06878.1 hemerythrin HHE cation binding domain-containing protein [Haloactinopolyspora alba]
MPDYGHDLIFGTFVPPSAQNADAVVKLAELTDELDLDVVSAQDHPYQPSFLDTWTLLSVIAARTRNVSVVPNVVNLPLRPPAVLARSAAALDLLSGGRVELGLGAGAFGDAVAAMGGPRRTPGQSVEALGEAMDVLRALWTPGPAVRYHGTHYQLDGAKPGPAPAHPVGLWVGSYKRRMLELTGRAADGWLPSAPYAPPEQLAGMSRTIDDAAEAAGRSPAQIRRLYNVGGSFEGTGRDFLQGPPAVWAEQLAELALTEGFSGFVLIVDIGGDDHLRRFAEEVVPAVRELVAAERAARPAGSAGATPTLNASTHGAVADDVAGPDEDSGASPGVEVTPPPAERFSDVDVWDESSRPHAPAPEAGTAYTDEGRAGGQRLVDIHNHLRQELDQLRSMIEQVAAGSLDPGAARSAINAMTMRQNQWTLGTYCESYCRVVTMHHTVEDMRMLPALREADPRLAPVVDRLAEEHEAIAGVLERVDAALVSMVGGDADGVTEVRRAVDLLTDTMLSHLSYEERELVEPLARIPVGI